LGAGSALTVQGRRARTSSVRWLGLGEGNPFKKKRRNRVLKTVQAEKERTTQKGELVSFLEKEKWKMWKKTRETSDQREHFGTKYVQNRVPWREAERPPLRTFSVTNKASKISRKGASLQRERQLYTQQLMGGGKGKSRLYSAK